MTLNIHRNYDSYYQIKIHVYIYIYTYIYMYIYMYIYSQTRVLSFPGLISVALVNE